MPYYYEILLLSSLFTLIAGSQYSTPATDPEQRFLGGIITNVEICDHIEPDVYHYQAETLTEGTSLRVIQVK